MREPVWGVGVGEGEYCSAGLGGQGVREESHGDHIQSHHVTQGARPGEGLCGKVAGLVAFGAGLPGF